MATTSRADDLSAHAVRDEDAHDRRLGEHIFIWCAWAVAAFFWGAYMTTLGHIFAAVATPTPVAVGLGWWAYLAIAGILALGGALAYGMFMTSGRDRRLDPAAEAKTAQLYSTDQPLPMR
ncbi:hypothetical protein LJR219_002268 [Phenylobacterium sp. LjRoot219]|uniref:hypothetical protein n=1 Tax=Phenylobacterium sp. LjRoot219 TaxID=3342283 RepID=UPI003ECDB81E